MIFLIVTVLAILCTVLFPAKTRNKVKIKNMVVKDITSLPLYLVETVNRYAKQGNSAVDNFMKAKNNYLNVSITEVQVDFYYA